MVDFFDDFYGYAIGSQPRGTWEGNLPTVQASGRNGGNSLAKSATQWIRRASGPYVWAVLRVDDPGQFIPSRVAARGYPDNSLTCRHWLLGVGQDRYAHMGLVATPDGALHLAMGSAYDLGANNDITYRPIYPCETLDLGTAALVSAPSVELIGSTDPGTIPIGRGWFVLEMLAVPGLDGNCLPALVKVWVNGKVVMEAGGLIGTLATILKPGPTPGTITAERPFVHNATWMAMGGGSVGSERIPGQPGWSGRIAAAGSFPGTGTDSAIGDLQVNDLLAAAESGTPISTIIGSSPAPTRVQSIDDWGIPDDGVTGLRYRDVNAPGVDEYTTAGLSIDPDASVYVVQVSAKGACSTPGFVVPRVGVATPGGASDTDSPVLFRGEDYRFYAGAMPRPGGGVWTPADLAALKLRIGRAQ